MNSVYPLPTHVGIGFTSIAPLAISGYEYKPVAGFHNYHVTPAAYKWPLVSSPVSVVIDGFSPNMRRSIFFLRMNCWILLLLF
jgi:hypothetical protein